MTNKAKQQFLTSTNNKTQQQFPADRTLLPHLQQYLFVMCHTAQQFHQRWGDSKNVLYHLGLT
jgi:hypothetical protein